VPLSETIMPGLPRRSINAASSRATRGPRIEVSGIIVRSELTMQQARRSERPSSACRCAGAVHRLENPGKIQLELIEVQTGSYFGEDDIIRIEDDYQRV
jgi:mannose-1-phosphate guanylyltransferase/mannose-6-phosphate isomerase